MDVAFAVDISDPYDKISRFTAINLIKLLIYRFNVEAGSVRVALVTYNSNAQLQFSFTDTYTDALVCQLTTE